MTLSRLVGAGLPILLLVAGFVGDPSPAQEPPKTGAKTSPQPPGQTEDEPDFKTGTQLIQLDLVVTDRQTGKRVGGLKREDFEVTENGNLRTIEFFNAIENGALLKERPTEKAGTNSTPQVATTTEFPDQTFLVVVDDTNITPANMTYVRQALTKFILEKTFDADRIAIVTTSGRLSLLQQLTSNRRFLKRAISRLTGIRSNTGAVPGDPSQLTEFQAQQIVNNDPEALELGIRRYRENAFDYSPREVVENTVRNNARQIVLEGSARTANGLVTIRNAIRMLRSVPGRKTVLLASDGFLLETRESDHRRLMDLITDAATRSNATIYGIGSAGLIALDATGRDISERSGIDQTGTASRLASQANSAMTDPLVQLSGDTGGFAVLNNNDPLNAFERVLKDVRNYYSIAYTPDQENPDGKFRRIVVRIRNHPEYEIRSQRGYFAPDEKAEAKAAEREARKASDRTARDRRPQNEVESEKLFGPVLRSVVPFSEIDLGVSAIFLPNAANNENTLISIAIGLKDLRLDAGQGAARNSLRTLLVLVDENGKVISVQENVIRPGAGTRASDFATFTRRIVLKPGFYQVRFAAKDELDGKIGSSQAWLEIPDLSKKTPCPGDILFLATPEGQDASPMATPESLAIRRFAGSGELNFSLPIYNVESSGTLSASVALVRNGKPLFETRPTPIQARPDTRGTVVYGASLPLKGIKPGLCRLVIRIHQGSKLLGEQEEEFTIR